MNIHKWEKHELKVFAESESNFLFLFIGLRIIIDDKYFCCSPELGLQELIPFRFEHNGKEIKGQIKTYGINTSFRVNYKLTIDDVVVGKFHVRAVNWWIAYLSLLILGVGIGWGISTILKGS